MDSCIIADRFDTKPVLHQQQADLDYYTQHGFQEVSVSRQLCPNGRSLSCLDAHLSLI